MDYSKQRLMVTDIKQINNNVRCYRFAPADKNCHLEGFKAGQYINLFYNINGATASRPYSIASSPKEAENGYYDLYIHGGGEFTSKWLFQNVAVGDVLEASKPIGEFCVDSSSSGNIIGISGGMSVTPLRSMARAVADGTIKVKLSLFCGWDKQEDVLFFEEFSKLSKSCENFNAMFAVANESVNGMEHGYVTRDIICSNADINDAEFYLCGPKEMYKFLEEELYPLNIPLLKYHTELPGEVKQGPVIAKNRNSDLMFTLRAEICGEVHEVIMRAEETILIAMERAGLAPESRCRSGSCGYCKAMLLEGTVFVDPTRETRSTVEISRGLIHTCCTYPLSDITIKISWL